MGRHSEAAATVLATCTEAWSVGHKGQRQPRNHPHMSVKEKRPGHTRRRTCRRSGRGRAGALLRDPLKTRPCLDSITAKVFYFLEHLDQRRLF